MNKAGTSYTQPLTPTQSTRVAPEQQSVEICTWFLLVAQLETIYGSRGASFKASVPHHERLATSSLEPQVVHFGTYKQHTNSTIDIPSCEWRGAAEI
jgi:hypothetical protein